MITAAEGQELLDLCRSMTRLRPGRATVRVLELAERVAQDAKVGELSYRLGVLCDQLHGEAENPPELLLEIRSVAEELAAFAPPEESPL